MKEDLKAPEIEDNLEEEEYFDAEENITDERSDDVKDPKDEKEKEIEDGKEVVGTNKEFTKLDMTLYDTEEEEEINVNMKKKH